ncbi:MAG: ribonuclease HII [bacterium]|nr:ribonuclease HII [bacterium]
MRRSIVSSVPDGLVLEERALAGQGVSPVAGVDEAGRGPLVGPVVAGAVVWPAPGEAEHEVVRSWLAGLDDSKTLTSETRARLFDLIQAHATAWGIGEASAAEIDEVNILNATFLAMRRAIADMEARLGRPVAHVLVDGNRRIKGYDGPQTPLVKGDSRSWSIAAGSILAKVHRDRLLEALHARFPAYGFDRHKGYPTAEHLAALREQGITPEHRRTFGPCKDL